LESWTRSSAIGAGLAQRARIDHVQLRHPQTPECEGLAGSEAAAYVHFTPTSGSWLNLVEIWFGIIERQAIHRGTLPSVRPDDQDPRLHQRLERPLPILRLDQTAD
jgi:hypothetical protein